MSSTDELADLYAENQRLQRELKDHIQTRADLLTYKHQMDAIFDNAPVELYLKDREGRYLRINHQFEQIFGVSNNHVVGLLPTDVHDSKLAQTTRDQDLAVLSSGKIERREEKARLVTDDLIHTLLTIKFPVFDADGKVEGLGAIVTDITEQKQAEERFHDIVNTIEGIVWEADASTFDITYASQRAERLLGYPIKEWFQPGFWVDRIHPEDRDAMLAYSNQCHLEGLESYELEYRLIAKDGRIVWVRDLISVGKENETARWLRGIMVDITHRKKIEEQIHKAEERFRKMFVAAPIGLLLIDIESEEQIEMNPAYCSIIGRDSAEMQSLGWKGITHPDDVAREQQLLENLKTGEIDSYEVEKRYLRPDGEVVWARGQLTPISFHNENDAPLFLAIVEDITQRKKFEEKIWHQANYDFLTGLPNRYMLQDRLRELIKKSRRDLEEFAILLIDLDGFKDVNDTLGHDKGDLLLIDAAARIRNCLHESDTVARLGGDEFVVIMSDFSDRSGIEIIAGRVIEHLSEPFRLGDELAYVSASIGITLFPDDGQVMLDLLKNADQAMYEAKRQGRSRTRYFTQNLHYLALNRMQLINDMREALKKDQFSLCYQPIFNLEDGLIYKTEALLRWQHPGRGMINPSEFILIAEESGLINEIGDWVFQQAVQQAADWQSRFATDIQISINTSPVQFENRVRICEYLQRWNLPGQVINIEITENLLMAPDPAVLDTLLEFRDAGIQVALDDFGTGYSSLAYLQKFDIDYLKIDRAFIQNLKPDSDDLALCAGIVAMAHTLGIEVIAEGIETLEQKNLLLEIGCGFGQGYFLGKPIPALELEQTYMQHKLRSLGRLKPV